MEESIFRKKLNIRLVWILLFLLILMSVSIFIFLVFSLEWEGKEALDYTAKITLVVLAILTLLYHWYNLENQIRTQQKNNSQNLAKYTYDICADFRKPSMMNIIENTRKIINDKKDLLKTEEKIQEFEDFLNKDGNKKYRKSLIVILNYFESISAMVLSGDLDIEIVKRLFGTLFGRYYIRLRYYIDYRQEIESPKSWANFEKLAKKWLQEDKN